MDATRAVEIMMERGVADEEVAFAGAKAIRQMAQHGSSGNQNEIS